MQFNGNSKKKTKSYNNFLIQNLFHVFEKKIAGDGTHPEFGHHMSEVPPPEEIESNAHLKSS